MYFWVILLVLHAVTGKLKMWVVLREMSLDLIFGVAVISRQIELVQIVLQCLRPEGRCLHLCVSPCCCRFFLLIPLLFMLVVFSRMRIFSLTHHLLCVTITGNQRKKCWKLCSGENRPVVQFSVSLNYIYFGKNNHFAALEILNC